MGEKEAEILDDLLICNCGGWSTNCNPRECLRANDGLALRPG